MLSYLRAFLQTVLNERLETSNWTVDLNPELSRDAQVRIHLAIGGGESFGSATDLDQ